MAKGEDQSLGDQHTFSGGAKDTGPQSLRPSFVSRAFHTAPTAPTPNRCTSSKCPIVRVSGATSVSVSSPSRLNELLHESQTTSLSSASSTTSNGLWQCGQRICITLQPT